MEYKVWLSKNSGSFSEKKIHEILKLHQSDKFWLLMYNTFRRLSYKSQTDWLLTHNIMVLIYCQLNPALTFFRLFTDWLALTL